MGLIFQRESRIPVGVSGRTVYTENEIRGHPNDFFIVIMLCCSNPKFGDFPVLNSS